MAQTSSLTTHSLLVAQTSALKTHRLIVKLSVVKCGWIAASPIYVDITELYTLFETNSSTYSSKMITVC